MKKSLYLVLASVLTLFIAACTGQVVVPAPTEAPTVPEPAVQPAPVSAGAIVNILWQWSDLVETEPAAQSVVPNPENFTIVFRPDGTVNMQADCNVVGGVYTLRGNNLIVESGPSTLAFCGEDSLDEQYLTWLSRISTVGIEGNRLILSTADGAARMGFKNGGPAPLPGAGGGLDIDPSQIRLDTMGLPYSWQANRVPATPYDASQPPGPMGLPEHIQINFGVVNPADKRPGDPVMYIIPVAAYRQLWEASGDLSVTNVLNKLQTLLTEKPEPLPTSGMPVLPFEEVGGTNDLAVQGEYVNFGSWEGVRFVGRHVQGPNPVTNEGLRYIFQGFSPDGKYLIAFFYPVTTSHLPRGAEEVPAAEMQQVDTDPEAYLQEKAAMLNALGPTEWDPSPPLLDSVLASLEYGPPQAIGPIPTVVVPTPPPQKPWGRVIAPGGVNIRSGPGTKYPVIGIAPFGAQGEIVGRSADGAWWVARVPAAPNGLGWVSAGYVEATNAAGVPVLPAPPPPTPKPTATPVPSPTPVPQIKFWTDRTAINQGECTTLRWKVEFIQAVWVYPLGEPHDKYPVTGEGSRQVCPTTSTTYEMRVLKRDGALELRQVAIQVNPTNPLVNTGWQLTAMNVNEMPVPGTTVALFFEVGDSLNGKGGCNTYTGRYSVNGGNLSIDSVIGGQASCGGAIDTQEQAYLRTLLLAVRFELSGDQLIIRDASGAEILRFTRIR